VPRCTPGYTVSPLWGFKEGRRSLPGVPLVPPCTSAALSRPFGALKKAGAPSLGVPLVPPYTSGRSVSPLWALKKAGAPSLGVPLVPPHTSGRSASPLGALKAPLAPLQAGVSRLAGTPNRLASKAQGRRRHRRALVGSDLPKTRQTATLTPRTQSARSSARTQKS